MMPMRRRTVAAILAALLTSATLVAQKKFAPLAPAPPRALAQQTHEVISPLPPPPPHSLPEIQPGPVHPLTSEEVIRRELEATGLRRGALQAQPSSGTPKQTDEWKPISELPPDEKLPAAPMLVAAYIVVLLAFFAYVLSLARRMRSVTQEIDRLEAELKRHPQR